MGVVGVCVWTRCCLGLIVVCTVLSVVYSVHVALLHFDRLLDMHVWWDLALSACVCRPPTDIIPVLQVVSSRSRLSVALFELLVVLMESPGGTRARVRVCMCVCHVCA